MDPQGAFQRAWNERFPHEIAPEVNAIEQLSQVSASDTNDTHDGRSASRLQSTICQKRDRIQQLEREIEKERFVIQYLENLLEERGYSGLVASKNNNGSRENLSGSKLVRGRPMVGELGWPTKGWEDGSVDHKQPLEKRPILKPKPASNVSFSGRTNPDTTWPTSQQNERGERENDVLSNNQNQPTDVIPDYSVKKGSLKTADAPMIPPKPRQSRKMKKLIQDMGMQEEDSKMESRDRSLDSLSRGPSKKLNDRENRSNDRGSVKDSSWSYQKRRGSREVDDIPRARDLSSSIHKRPGSEKAKIRDSSPGYPAQWKRGSRDDLDKRSRESSPQSCSDPKGRSLENLLATYPHTSGSDSPKVLHTFGKGVETKPRSDSAATYDEVSSMLQKRQRDQQGLRPSSFVNKTYELEDDDDKKYGSVKLDSKKLSLARFNNHEYVDVDLYRPESNTGSREDSYESPGYDEIRPLDSTDGDPEGLYQRIPTHGSEVDSAGSSASSDDEMGGSYDNALDVTEDLMDDSSSDDDERIYYNLICMNPPLISMASADEESTESLYVDPREIIMRKREQHEVQARLNSSGERKVKKTIHQRLSMEIPQSPEGKSPARTSFGSDNVFVVSSGTVNSKEVPRPFSLDLDARDGHGVDKRASTPILDGADGEYVTLKWKRKANSEKFPSPGQPAMHEDQLTMRKLVVSSILDSENSYIDCLSVLLQYMKSLLAAATTSQHVLPTEDIHKIFFRLPEIHEVHVAFVEQLTSRVEKWNVKTQIADLFKELIVKQFEVYKDYLLNYKWALSTVQKCSQENEQFHELVKAIKGKGIQGAESLEQLLHKPILRIQRNGLVLQDLIRCTPQGHHDLAVLESALKLSSYNIENLVDPMSVGSEEKDDRHLLKNSLIVEQVQGNRKLRHVFLFSDVLVCTKPKMGNRSKCNFEVKWYVPVSSIKLDDTIQAEVEQEIEKKRKQEVDALKKRVSVLKDDLKKEIQKEQLAKDRTFSFGGLGMKSVEKLKKKLVEQQAALVLASPKLVFRIYHKQNKVFTFLMSSDYEREEWREAIKAAQAKNPKTVSLEAFDVQSLVNSSRQIPRVNVLGSMLMRQGQEEEIMYGVLNVTVARMMGLKSPADTFCCLEVDSFGTFSMQAKTNLICNSLEPKWNESFEITLDGSQTLRVLCYKQQAESDCLLGKCAIELNQDWLKKDFQEMTLPMGELYIDISVQYMSRQQTMKRIQSRIKTGVFGVKLKTLIVREGNDIPLIITACTEEVEKRGIDDVGIYRVSGISSEIQRLKKAFEKNSKVAVNLLGGADIHAVSGLLKLYLRELPEALFTDHLYGRFVDGLGLVDPIAKERCMLSLFKALPESNHLCILHIMNHLWNISKHESTNKMSIRNLATIFGPTLLRPAVPEEAPRPEELLCLSTRDVLDQSGILQYFLDLLCSGHDFNRL